MRFYRGFASTAEGFASTAEEFVWEPLLPSFESSRRKQVLQLYSKGFYWLSLLIAAAIAFLTYVGDRDPWTILFCIVSWLLYPLLAAAFITAVSSIHERELRLIERRRLRRLYWTAAKYRNLCKHGWSFQAITYSLYLFFLTTVLAASVSPNMTLGLLILVVLVTVIFLNRYVLLAVLSRSRRTNIMNDLVGRWAPWIFAMSYLVVMIAVFSSVGIILTSMGLIEYVAAEGDPTSFHISLSLLWHLANVVPFLEVPATLDWNQPLAYQLWSTGLFVLLFKLSVIVPLALATKDYYEYHYAELPRNEPPRIS